MKDLLQLKSSNTNIDIIEINGNIDKLCRDIISKTKEINNCILYDLDDNLSEDNIDFEYMLKIINDFTGCEMCFNEICISYSKLKIEFIPHLVNKLKTLFNIKFPNKKIFKTEKNIYILTKTYNKMYNYIKIPGKSKSIDYPYLKEVNTS